MKLGKYKIWIVFGCVVTAVIGLNMFLPDDPWQAIGIMIILSILVPLILMVAYAGQLLIKHLIQ